MNKTGNRKGFPAWNKGQTGIKTNNKGQTPWNKGFELPKETRLKISRATVGDLNHKWKGGKHIGHGYSIIGNVSGGKVREHRRIMEVHLKRKLRAGEVIHHKNGIKTDNRLSNLELFESHSEHMKKYHYKNAVKIKKSK